MNPGMSSARAAPAPAASSSKLKQSIPAKPVSSEKPSKKELQKEKVPEKQPAKEKETSIAAKPKATGKLDFSKAKTKETKKAEAKAAAETKIAQSGKEREASTSNVKKQAIEIKAKKEEPKVCAYPLGVSFF